MEKAPTFLSNCQPGDILEVIPTDEEKIKFF